MIYEDIRDNEEYFNIGRNASNVHFHRAIEILYCLEHPKTVYIDSHEVTVNEGELLIVPPFSTHYFPIPEIHRSICVVFPVKFTDDFEKLAENQWFDRFVVTDKALALDIYQHMKNLENTPNPMLRKGIYNYILGILLEKLPLVPRDPHPESSFALRTLTYLEKHYSDKLSLEQVAAALGYNRCYFSTLFKKTFHTGFSQYLSMLRVRKSLPLLQTQSISEAAYTVGFGSLQNYYTAFKRIYGKTPGVYLSQLQNSDE